RRVWCQELISDARCRRCYRHAMSTPTRALPGAGTLLVATLLVSALAGCGGSGADGNPELTPIPPSASESVGDAPAPSPPPPRPEAAADLPEGRHPGLIADVDVVALTMKFDLVEFLTGEAAREAYLKDFPDDASGPPNDYWVVNANPRLRTLAISP